MWESLHCKNDATAVLLPGEVKTLFDAMEVTYDWEQLVVAVRSLRARPSLPVPAVSCSPQDIRSMFRYDSHGHAMSTSQRCRRAQGLRQEILSISKFNTGCVNHLFRSVAFWRILHRSYSLTRHMQLINVKARCSIAARWCPRPLWHRCYPISTFFASHSVQIVWFGFACLPSWPSLPAWAWFMSTCQQGRPEETWRNCVSFCFIVSTCFGMFRHSHTFASFDIFM